MTVPTVRLRVSESGRGGDGWCVLCEMRGFILGFISVCVCVCVCVCV